jgi:hypothetical protein
MGVSSSEFTAFPREKKVLMLKNRRPAVLVSLDSAYNSDHINALCSEILLLSRPDPGPEIDRAKHPSADAVTLT